MTPDDRRAFRFTPAAKPEPCWSNGCEAEPMAEQSQRWRGRYCADCERALAADAARIAEDFGVA